MRAKQDNPTPRRRRGFTLIELLVVIAIIGLLVSILMPSFFAARRLAYRTRTIAIRDTLVNGIDQYKQKTGLYPGQSPEQRARLDNDDMSGSELLARILWTPPDEDWDDQNFRPESAYADFREDFLMGYEGEDDLISDDFANDPMPFLYYPCRPGKDGEPANAQYSAGHNDRIDTPAGGDFYDFIADRSRSNRSPYPPYNEGTYLLIAAGGDREYFTRDDVTNIPGKQ